MIYCCTRSFILAILIWTPTRLPLFHISETRSGSTRAATLGPTLLVHKLQHESVCVIIITVNVSTLLKYFDIFCQSVCHVFQPKSPISVNTNDTNNINGLQRILTSRLVQTRTFQFYAICNTNVMDVSHKVEDDHMLQRHYPWPSATTLSPWCPSARI
jgi:mannose/fructose/N-acetylgalactosamine-specific phosphotransferase system component IIC